MHQLIKRLTLRDRNLIRLKKHNCLERFHADKLAELGDVEIYNADIDFNLTDFPYPFGNVGAVTMDFITPTRQAEGRLLNLLGNDPTNYITYKDYCPTPELDWRYDQILYDYEEAVERVGMGKRDIIKAYNSGQLVEHSFRTVDPDLRHEYEDETGLNYDPPIYLD